jgi:hypothetical protein
MSLGYRHHGGNRFRRPRVWAFGLGTLAFLLALLTANASSTHAAVATDSTTAPACTMVGKGVFVAGSQQISKEDKLSTDTSQPQSLVLRSLTGPAKYFRLTSLSAGTCSNNPAFPPEETGNPVNLFKGNGAGNFGTSFSSNSPGYTIAFELGDYGDGSSTDNTHADSVSFAIKRNSDGTIVWSGRGTLTSGSQEIQQGSGPPPPPPGSCEPSSSLDVLVQGTNVVSYVPKGNWENPATGVDAVNVEGSSITNTSIPTANAVNSAASNPNTGDTVATSNGTDVYIIHGTSVTHTLTDGGSGTISFSGGSPTTSGVAIDATHNRAVVGVSDGGTPAFQFLDLSSLTFGSLLDSPNGQISEDPLLDPTRNLLLSAAENNTYEIADVTNPASPKFFENPTGSSGELDSSGEDCSTGIALAPAEFSNPSSVFVADLTQATFTPGSPGTWTAPSQNQSLSESSLSAGASGLAVAQGTHTGVVAGEFGGNAITAIRLPSTSGSGVPAIQDWVTCSIGNTPDGNGWNEGLDPHTVTAYQSPNDSDAIGLFADSGPNWLARVDLTKLLNPALVPRDAAGHACSAGTIPSSVESFISLP